MGRRRIVFRDLEKVHYGRLVIVRDGKPDKQGKTRFVCDCSCGATLLVSWNNIRNENTTSCGCLGRERRVLRKTTHGKYHTAEYKIWAGIKTRCCNLNIKVAHNYSGRGIKMCKRWMSAFENFYEDMGPRPSAKHSIERKNNDKGYSPSNCVWATTKEQSNNRRSNRRITIDGTTKTLMQWSEQTGMPYHVIKHRLNLEWDARTAMTAPIRKIQRKSK